ncbi:MAG: DUF6893 family small protein [Egibacteraceae bacterium]
MEKWILRTMLGTVAVMLTAAVVASLDDIKRYVKIRSM